MKSYFHHDELNTRELPDNAYQSEKLEMFNFSLWPVPQILLSEKYSYVIECCWTQKGAHETVPNEAKTIPSHTIRPEIS